MPKVRNAYPVRASLFSYLLFSLTGLGLVLPGTLLPELAKRWGGRDGSSGMMFFCFFVGTSLGAVAARGRLRRGIACATAIAVSSVIMLDRLPGTTFLIAFLLYGFGLGLLMTAITLVYSRASPLDRRVSLTRLNLVWAIGACSGPFLLLRTTTLYGVTHTVQAFASILLAIGLATAWQLPDDLVPAAGSWRAWQHMRNMPPFYVVCLPLVTGIEAAVGGWITTYSKRDTHAGSSEIFTATTLWAGLLLSRSVFSRAQSANGQRRWAASAMAMLAVFGLVLLLITGKPWLDVAGAFSIGFGIGPLYPHLLSQLLDKGEAGNAGFLAAGAGSALMPFLLGQVSQLRHSVRQGLFVPLLGALMLLALLRGKRGRDQL